MSAEESYYIQDYFADPTSSDWSRYGNNYGKFLLENLSNKDTKYLSVIDIQRIKSNYKFITNKTATTVFSEFSKMLGYDVRNSQSSYTIYNKEYRTYHTENSTPKRKREKIIYHYQSHLLNKKYFRGNSEFHNLSRKDKLIEGYNILKHQNIAIKEFPHTEIIAMDIDTHNYFDKIYTPSSKRKKEFESLSKSIFDTIKSNIPIHILYVEVSKIQRGMHIFFKLQNSHNKLLIQEQLKTYLQSEFKGIIVEYRTNSHALRLPLSADYQCRDIDTFLKKIKLKNIIISTYERNKKEISISNNNVLEHLKSLNGYSDIPFFGEENKTIFYRQSLRSPINPIFTNSDSLIDIKEKFKITAGNRIGGDRVHWRLVNYCHLTNKTFDEFVNLTLACNINSKDIQHWHTNGKLHKECLKIWNYSLSRFKPYDNYIAKNKNKEFISNIYLLNNDSKRLVKQFMYKLKKSLPENKFRNRLVKDSYYPFLEFLGKIHYENINPRSIHKNVKLTTEKRKELLLGCQFPNSYLYKVKEYYKINSDIKVIFNIFKSIFLEKIIHSNGSSYIPSLGSCNQYKLLDCYNYILDSNSMLSDVKVGYNMKGFSLLQSLRKMREFLPNVLVEKHIIMSRKLNLLNRELDSLSYKYRDRITRIRNLMSEYHQKIIKLLNKLKDC